MKWFVPRLLTAGTIAMITFNVDAQQIAAPGTVDCASTLAKNPGHSKLAATFGPQNVVFETIGTFEEFTAPASIVFPDDPKRRLEFLWKNGSAKNNLLAIWITEESLWTGPLGVRLGMSIDEVEKLNTKPFKLSGFGWDYGGLVADWQGGAMAHLPRGCSVSLKFEPDPQVRDIDSVVGEERFLSNNKDMRAVRPVVRRILIGYNN